MNILKTRWPIFVFILVIIVLFVFLFYFSYKELNQEINAPQKSDFNTNNNFEFNDVNKFRPPNRFVNSLYAFGIMGFFGLLAGAFIFYFLSTKLVKTKSVQKKNTKIILNFLSKEEKQIIETLIKNNGEVYQYELNRLDGVSKVKAHRVLKNLEDKEIISKKNFGKVNKIVLNNELFEVLKDN
jgi:uncharacterized membrane protein